MSIKLKRVLASVVSLVMLVTFINIPAVSGKVLAEGEELDPVPTSATVDSISYEFNFEDGTACVVGVANLENVWIPSFVEYNGSSYCVTSIGSGTGALMGGAIIKTISIPYTVRTVNQGAFFQLTNISEVIFQEDQSHSHVFPGYESGLTIDSAAFMFCSNLKDLFLPSILTNTNPSALQFAGSSDFTIHYPCNADSNLIAAMASLSNGATYHPLHRNIIFLDDYICTDCNQSVEPIIEEYVVGHSLTVGGKIGINFYYQLSQDILINPNAYVRFTLPNGSVQEIPVSEGVPTVVDSVRRYVFSCYVDAKEMADEINAQVIVPSRYVGEPTTYSVREYANNVPQYDQPGSLKDLVDSMLIYGTLAQQFFGYRTDDYAIDISMARAAISRITTDSLSDYAQYATTQGNEVLFVGSNLTLLSGTTLGMYFMVPDEEIDPSTVSFKIGNTDLKAEQRGEYLYVAIDDISARDLSYVFSVDVYVDGQLDSTVNFCALSYCYSVLAYDNVDDLQDLARAIYNYANIANEYAW